jgi:hypothetical protein
LTTLQSQLDARRNCFRQWILHLNLNWITVRKCNRKSWSSNSRSHSIFDSFWSFQRSDNEQHSQQPKRQKSLEATSSSKIFSTMMFVLLNPDNN